MKTTVPTPKFSIGQIVWLANATYSDFEVQCPDCRGECSWSVTTPAGETFDVPCSTCSSGWGHPTGFVRSYAWRSDVRPLTIGSIQIDTHNDETPVRYMARETGVGSGTLWREDHLCSTREEAEAAADVEVRRRKTEKESLDSVDVAKKKRAAIHKPRSK